MVEEKNDLRKMILLLSIVVIVLTVFLFFVKDTYYFVVSSGTYFWFHATAEFLTVAVGLAIFYFSEKSYKSTGSKAIRLIGWAFGAMAIIDIFHTIAYKGFPNPIFMSGSNVAIWFWLPARSIGAILLFFAAIATYFPEKFSEKRMKILGTAIVIFIILLVSAVIYNTTNEFLPKMFVDGKGLTQTKIYWEWLVIATFTLTILIFLKNLVKNRNRILLMFLLGFIATIFSELAFMLYRNPFDVFNLTGHLLKLVAYLFFIFGVYYSIRKE